MRCGEDPLRSYQRASAQVLVEGIYQGYLPAPLVGVRVLTAHHARIPFGASCLKWAARGTFHAAYVFAVHGISSGGGNRCCLVYEIDNPLIHFYL